MNKLELEYDNLIVGTGLFVTANDGKKIHEELVVLMGDRNVPYSERNKVLRLFLCMGISIFFLKEINDKTLKDEIGLEIVKITKKIKKGNLSIDQVIEDIKNIEYKKNISKDCKLLKIREKKITNPRSINRFKFILKEIYREEWLNKQFEDKKCGKIELEHILPQTLEEYSCWYRHFTDEDKKDFFNKMGNLTLLEKEINSHHTVSNEAFCKKKKGYVKSKIKENNNIAKEKEWTKAVINNRTNEISYKIADYLKELKKI